MAVLSLALMAAPPDATDVVAQAERALKDGSAKMLGTREHSAPPVPNPDAFPHFPGARGVDVATTVYVIQGRVYAKRFFASGSYTLWFDCGARETPE